MKLPKFIICIALVTIISLCMVYQQTEITLLAYQHGKNSKAYQDLLDKNISLRYNLETVRSISYLGTKVLVDNADFEIPSQRQLAQIQMPVNNQSFFSKALPKETILSKILGARKEAEAKTIK